ncbi:MAG: hypothetical protein AABW85_05545 [archaeon]
MDVSIGSKEKNRFLKMDEIKFEVAGMQSMPKRKEIREKLAALTNSKEEMVIVKSIRHKFGSHVLSGTARIYDSKQSMEKTEPKYMLERNFGKAEKKEQPKQEEQAAPVKAKK